MSAEHKAAIPLLLGGHARNFAAWMALAGSLVLLWISFLLSWPLGPDYVDEGSITRIRLAIATLGFGLALALGFIMFFLVAILRQVKRLREDVTTTRENKT